MNDVITLAELMLDDAAGGDGRHGQRDPRAGDGRGASSQLRPSGPADGHGDVATVLFTRHLRFDPADPAWPDRDRFVLSAGHGSMLLYALLHLCGYPGDDRGRDCAASGNGVR